MRGFVGEYFPSPECSEYLTPREGICQKTCVEGDEEMFLCNDGRYIDMSYICNFIPDCYDGSDEYCGKELLNC